MALPGLAMRSLRLPAAGLLLLIAALLLTALLVPQAHRWIDAVVVHIGRTPPVLTAGLALWASIFLFTRGRGALATFSLVWIILCAVNGALGVTGAGYTVSEEIPVFALNAGVPIAVALLYWKLTKTSHARKGNDHDHVLAHPR